MINKSHILPKVFSKKRVGAYVKSLLASNIALGLIALPGTPSNYISQAQSNLIIPQQELDSSFNIQAPKNNDIVQIPIKFIYMSQRFSSFHPGIDLATDYGTPIEPIKAGVVEEAGYSPFGYGNEVLIDNGNGIESLYAHLSKIEVKKGDEVGIYTELGKVGSTGHSTGPHLHLEVHRNGVPINPLSFLPSLHGSDLLTSR